MIKLSFASGFNWRSLRDEKTTTKALDIMWAKALLALLIVAQTLFFVALGAQKREYHIDEIYSYLFSNSAHAESFSFADWLIDDWVPGREFDTITTVQRGEELCYDAPYRNTALDCHPPLYYWALHTVCLFFPDVLSKWFGIGLNILFFVIGQILLYVTCHYLTESKPMSLIAVVLYGFSSFAVTTVQYARMYMMLSMFALAYVYFTLRVLREGPSLSTVLPASIVLYLGAMTQYYFLIFAFWVALILGIHLLRKGEIRGALLYGTMLCLAVLAMFVSFPYVIDHVRGTSTNNIGNEITKSAFDLKLWGHQTKELVLLTLRGFCFSGKLDKIFLVVATAGILAYSVMSRCSFVATMRNMGFEVWLLSASFALTFLTIAKVGGHYVYLRYILFVVPVLYLILATVIMRIPVRDASGAKRTLTVVASLLMTVALADALLVAYRGDDSFTYAPFADKTAAVVSHKEEPLIVMLARESDGDVEMTANYTRMRSFDQVYVGAKDHVLKGGVLRDCLKKNGSCLLYIPTDTYWIRGYNSSKILAWVEKALGPLSVTSVTEVGLGQYYLLEREG